MPLTVGQMYLLPFEFCFSCPQLSGLKLFVTTIENAPLGEFMYPIFTRMLGKSYRRRLRSLLLYLCYVFRALINSLVCWFRSWQHHVYNLAPKDEYLLNVADNISNAAYVHRTRPLLLPLCCCWYDKHWLLPFSSSSLATVILWTDQLFHWLICWLYVYTCIADWCVHCMHCVHLAMWTRRFICGSLDGPYIHFSFIHVSYIYIYMMPCIFNLSVG